MTNPIERVHYFNGEYLNAADFQTEQNYNMETSAWLNRSMFTYGVARGLHVTDQVNQRLLCISPGMAIDSLGREIILTANVSISHNCNPGLYYLTISYGEEYGEPVKEDLEGQALRLNFKRIIANPEIQFKTDQGEAGLHILLAIVTISNNGAVASIEYDNGQSMRRQCGVNAGTVHFKLEGVDNPPAIQGFQNRKTQTYGLLVNAPQTIFNGPVTCRQTLCVGDRTGSEAMTVRALNLTGIGRVISQNTTVTSIDGPFRPVPCVGDVLIARTEVGPSGERRRITEIYDAYTVAVALPFNVPLQKVGYSIEREGVAGFYTTDGQAIMKLDGQGNAGLGVSPLAPAGTSQERRFVLDVQSSGKVGIALNRRPEETLTVGGNVKADAFIGDGSKLTGISGLWPVSPARANDIYYDRGAVSVGSPLAWAALSVCDEPGVFGVGTITSEGSLVTGDTGGTPVFSAQFRPGSQLQVVDDQGQARQATVTAIVNETSVTVEPAFDPAITSASAYSILRPPAAFYNRTREDPVLMVGRDARVGINMAAPDAALDVNGDLKVRGQLKIASIDLMQIQADTVLVEDELNVGNGAAVLNKDGRFSFQGALSVNGMTQVVTLSAQEGIASGGTLSGQSLTIAEGIQAKTLTVSSAMSGQSLTISGAISTQDLQAGGSLTAATANVGTINASGPLSVGQSLSLVDGSQSGTFVQEGGTNTLTTATGFVVQTNSGEQGSMSVWNNADVMLENPIRKVKGRALAILSDGTLCLNFNADFPNGVKIPSNLLLTALPVAPQGATMVNLVIDPNTGRVYLAQ